MILRLFLLLTLIGQVGPSASSDDADHKLGGQGTGTVLMIIAFIGAIVLAALVVIGILALTGRFEHSLMDPAV